MDVKNYYVKDTSIWLTEPKAIILASVSVAILLLILLYLIASTIIQKQHKKGKRINKFILYVMRPSWTIWVSLIFALIMGGVFWGLDSKNHIIFDPSQQEPFGNRLWAWQSIQFLYAIGSWIVIFILFSLWLAIPFISFLSVKNILEEKQTWQFHAKRLLWVLVLTIITVAVSNLMWAIPMNDHQTSSEVFKINENYQDQFYRSAKWVYVYIFQAEWYAWTFVGFSFISLLSSYLLVKLTMNKKYSLVNSINKVMTKDVRVDQTKFETKIKYSFKFFTTPFSIFNSLGSLEMYAFIVAYSLFNMDTLWIHVATILLVSLLCYVFISIFIYVTGLIKYKNAYKEFSHLMALNLWNSIKPFFFIKASEIDVTKIKDKDIQETYSKNTQLSTLNLSLNIVVPISFTIFLGLNNHVEFNDLLQVGSNDYTITMHQPIFWSTLLLGSLMLSYNTCGVNKAGAYGKNIAGASAYSIAPGLQTGVLGDLSSTLSHFAKWTDTNLKLVF